MNAVIIMQRYFINEPITNPYTIRDETIVHHLLHVLRSKEDDQFILCDDQEHCFLVEITNCHKTEVMVRLVHAVKTTHSQHTITLAASLIRKEKYELVLQKATELGVHTIMPVFSKRSIIQFDKKTEAKKIKRWETITKEAAEQSHRSDLVSVTSPINLLDIDLRHYDTVILAYEQENQTALKTVLRACKKDAHILVIVGPEGGFAEEEVNHLTKNGAHSVSLGTRILRAETASLYLLSTISYELEEH